MTSAIETLSRRVLPWLEPQLAQLETARRAGSLGHAWLISGPAGVGKVNFALVLAHRLLSDAADHGALDADAALAAMAARHEPMDRHADLHWLYPGKDKENEKDKEKDEDKKKDKKTISIHQVRDVVETLTLTAHGGGAKVVLIEPAEALTPGAANALLKTLEEPTPRGYLFLLSHQPGRLSATVRSRCQHVSLRVPNVATVARWLGASPAIVLDAQRAVGAAPLRVAGAVQDDNINIFKTLESSLADISQDRIDPQVVAQSWAKGDPEVALTWLRRRIHEELRLRLATPKGSTEVTVPAGVTLHNAWQALPTRTLFDEYDRAEKLLIQLGSGLNIELALAAMLNALVVNRGRS
jgi:DNA polymerase III subunit delta'